MPLNEGELYAYLEHDECNHNYILRLRFQLKDRVFNLQCDRRFRYDEAADLCDALNRAKLVPKGL